MFTYLPITALLLSLILGFTACNENDQEKKTGNTTDTVATSKPTNNAEADSINHDKTIFPVYSELQTKVLTTGNFHSDEVWKNADKEKWMGLFKNKAGFYLEKTIIKTKRVFDPVLDGNENEKTGWEVATANKDSNYLIMEALPFLSEQEIGSITISKKIIYPDEEFNFTYLGNDYTLFATGEKIKDQNDPKNYAIKNYKLFLKATLAGQQKTQLLAAEPNFDDKMIEILFSGDIDNDGILDFIIDTSAHYNMRRPTLYSSKPADKKQIVKPVGAHETVGG